MENNKVVKPNGEVIMDITDTTAEAADVAAGEVFYDKAGVRTVGTGNYMNKVSNPTADNILVTDENGQAVDSGVGISDKQDTLVSGTNLKTVNNQSLLGSGNIDAEPFIAVEDVTSYADIKSADDAGRIIVVDAGYHNYPTKVIVNNAYVLLESFSQLGQGIVSAITWRVSASDNSWTYISNTIAGGKADLVPNPVDGEVLITDAYGQPQSSGTSLETLLNDVEAGKEAFMLKDFNQSINITIPSVTEDVANTSIPNMDVDLDVIDPTGELNTKYAIAGLVKYEISNGSTRLNAFPVCSFSMNGQRTLRLRCMVGGTSSKAATNIKGALLLKHR